MSEFDHKITINAPAGEVFAFVSDPVNLPEYLPTVEKAELEGGRIRVEGEANGRHYVSDGDFRRDSQARRMEWNSDGNRDYSGWLSVAGDDVTSEVSVHLHFGGDPHIGKENPGASIHEGIVRALESIQNIVEKKGGKIDHDIYGGTHDASYSNEIKTR